MLVALTFMQTYGFGMTAITYAGLVVWEKENKLKYAIQSMGGTLMSYWLSNLTVDLLLFMGC